VSVTLILRDKQYEVRAGITARRALEEIGIPRESVLITRKGELITEDEVLKEGEVIKLISVISGGKT
jgi:sulfur carrier protein ThiS